MDGRNDGRPDGKQADHFGGMEPNTQLDSTYVYPERTRRGYVQGPADLEYGMVDGFRYGIEQTGHRFKRSILGERVREGPKDSDEQY